MDSAGLTAASSTLASLFAIFLILGGAVVLLRRWRARLPGAANAQGTISILASRPLGGQHALVIAEAEGCRFLIGVSRTGVTAIGRLDDHG